MAALSSWYTRQDLNLRPLVPETNALSTELRVRKTDMIIANLGFFAVGRLFAGFRIQTG
jgi:hypothetical protein